MKIHFHFQIDNFLLSLAAINIILRFINIINWPWYVVLWPIWIYLLLGTIILTLYPFLKNKRR